MEKLVVCPEGKYFIGVIEVTPMLVYGPVTHRYNPANGKNLNPMAGVIKRIKQDKGIDLEKIANSYISRGININQPEETVADGKISARTERMEFIYFFKSITKGIPLVL